MQNHAHLVNLEKLCKMSRVLLSETSIQPRTAAEVDVWRRRLCVLLILNPTLWLRAWFHQECREKEWLRKEPQALAGSATSLFLSSGKNPHVFLYFFHEWIKIRDSPSGYCQLGGSTRFQKWTRYPEKVESTRKNGPVPNTPPNTPVWTLPTLH